VLLAASERKPVSAIIEINEDDAKTRELQFIGERLPELKAFYTFDSTSIQVHLNEANNLSFSPFGLVYLKFLAEETDKIRERLSELIIAKHPDNKLYLRCPGDSLVRDLLKDLSKDTNLEELKALAELSVDEEAKLLELDNQITHLKSQNLQPLIHQLQREIQDMRELRNRLEVIATRLDESTVQSINATILSFVETQRITETVGVSTFTRREFSQIGTPGWLEFIGLAKRLADAERPNEPYYPSEDDICLLCHQPLRDEGNEVIKRLWTFLQVGAQSELQTAREEVAHIKQSLQHMDLDFLDEESIYRRYLEDNKLDLLNKLQKSVELYREIRGTLTSNLESAVETHYVNVDPYLTELDAVISNISMRLHNLETEQGVKFELERLEEAFCLLKHRQTLSEILPDVEALVNEYIWIDKASKVGGNTKKITKKHNELFDKLVTQRFINKFEDTLKQLGRPLKVEILTRGSKGQTYRQIVLKSDSSNSKTKTDKVLSEGEKRAVAFADFITEVSLDDNSCGVILDDPVTSLDLEWRRVIAELLVEEAVQRQVIIFTHDISFMYILGDVASSKDITPDIHWIKRGEDDDKPGYVYLNNAPSLEKQYKKPNQAKAWYEQAKAENEPRKQLELLRQGIGALRTTYEAFVVFEVLQNVVQRFDDRLNIKSLESIAWHVDTGDVVKEINRKHAALSRYIEGHLHVDDSPHEPLSVTLLYREIEEFSALHTRFKALKNATK